MQDIRLICGITDHPKTLRLIRDCGEEAFRCLLRLWLWARSNRPDGILDGMDLEDVEIAAGWTGINGLFSETLVRRGWMEKCDGKLLLHDWQKHQVWATEQTDRQMKASWGGLKARHGYAKAVEIFTKKWKCEPPAVSTELKLPSKGSSTISSTPSPSPSPSPSPKTEVKPRSKDIVDDPKKPDRPTLQEVIDYCRERGDIVDPASWYDHYTANGWRVGKNPMKDWKAAVRTWEKSRKNQPQTGVRLTPAQQAAANLLRRMEDDESRGASDNGKNLRTLPGLGGG